jgi:hypothetical protein
VYILIALFAFSASAAQEVPSMENNGEWGVLFDNNEGLHWISQDRGQDNLVVSYQTLFGMFTSSGSSNLSPDGKTLVLTAGGPNKAGGTYLVDVATGESTLLQEISTRRFHSQVWSPDGNWIAYCSDDASVRTDRSIRVMNIETHKEQIVIPRPFTFEWKGMTSSPYSSCVNWLDNNTLIFAVILYPPGTDYKLIFPFSALFTVEIDGSNLQQITPDNVDVGFPLFSLPSDFLIEGKDGKIVYFMCNVTRDPQRANKICRINLATSQVESVLDLSEFGIAANYETVNVPIEDMQDGDLMAEFAQDGKIQMNTMAGTIVSSFAVSPEEKIAVSVFSIADRQEYIYLFDPSLHSFVYLAQGRQPRWFYYQPDL